MVLRLVPEVLGILPIERLARRRRRDSPDGIVTLLLVRVGDVVRVHVLLSIVVDTSGVPLDAVVDRVAAEVGVRLRGRAP